MNLRSNHSARLPFASAARLILALAASGLPGGTSQAADKDHPSDALDGAMPAIIGKHCLECHSGDAPMGTKNHLVGYFDAGDQPAVVEFVDHLEARSTVRILPYGLATAQTVNSVGAESYTGPGLAVHWVEVAGPLYDRWPLKATATFSVTCGRRRRPRPTSGSTLKLFPTSRRPTPSGSCVRLPAVRFGAR